MIVVIAFRERDPKTGHVQTLVSHGVDDETGQSVTLPAISPEALGAVWNPGVMEYVLPE